MRYLTIILLFISSLAMAQRPYLFPTISDAASNTYIGIGAYVQTQGYNTSGDGGGALYRMTAIASAPMAADSGYVYPVTAGKVLVQVLEDEYLRTATYGVVCGSSAEATNNFNRLQRFFNAIDTLDKQAFVNGCNDTIYVNFTSALTTTLASHNKFVMRGEGADVTRIKATAGSIDFGFSDAAKVNLFDLYLDGYDATAFGGIGGMDQALTLDSTASSFTLGVNGGNSVTFSKGASTSNASEYLDTLTHIYTNRRMPFYDKKRSNNERITIGLIGDSNFGLAERFETPIKNKYEAAGFIVGGRYAELGDFDIIRSSWGSANGNSVSLLEFTGISGDTARINSIVFDTAIIAMDGSGVYDVYIDNDSVRRITVTGFQIDTIPTALASHSLSIRVVSDTIKSLGFAMLNNSADIQLFNFAKGGATVGDYNDIDSLKYVNQLYAYGVDAVLINLGTNDFPSQTPTQYAQNLLQFVNKIEGDTVCDIALIAVMQGNGSSIERTIAYRDSLINIANSKNLNYLSLHDLHGSAIEAEERGITDGLHYSSASYKIHGDVFFAFLNQRAPVVTATTSEFAYPITTYISDGSTTVNFDSQESGVFRINLGSTTYDSLAFINPFTTGSPQYLLHFSNVDNDTLVFPSNVISYNGDTLFSRIVNGGFAANLYYDGTNYYTQDTFGVLNETAPGGGGGGGGFLLDGLTAPYVAYSLRQLKTGVTSVVRVKRSSDSAEADFTATEVSDGTLATWVGGGSNGVVTVWYDQSGNGRDATIGAGAEPVIVSSGALVTENSLPAIDNNTTAQRLQFTGVTLSDFYISCVAKNVDEPGVILGNSSNSTEQLRYALSAQSIEARINGVSNTFTGFGVASITTSALITVTRAANSLNAYLNGSASTANPISDSNITTINQISAAFGNPSANVYQEIIIWNTDMSSDRAAIESNINTYYSVY